MPACSSDARPVQSLEVTAAADPARHAWNVLADFVDSLSGAEARRAVQKLVDWDRKLQVTLLHALPGARRRTASLLWSIMRSMAAAQHPHPATG